MHEEPLLFGFDPLGLGKREMDVFDQHDLGTVLATARDSGRVGVFRHHDLCVRAECGGSIRSRHRMISCAHGRDSVLQRIRTRALHVRQCAAWFERSSVLEKLELQEDLAVLFF